MSDAGHLSSRRSVRLAPEAVEQLVADAARAERTACQEFIRAKMAEVDTLRAKGRLNADEAVMLCRRLDAVADGIEAKLHLNGGG